MLALDSCHWIIVTVPVFGFLSALAGLTAVLGHAAFQWGGVVRGARYECLLGLGLVVLVCGFGRARGRMLDALGPVGAKTSFASLSVFPAGTFQQFLLVCGYVAVFPLVREPMWSFADRPWLVAAPVVAIAALEAAGGVTQYFGGAAAVGGVALLILLGIIFSFSRGGFLATLGAILTMGVVMLRPRGLAICADSGRKRRDPSTDDQSLCRLMDP